MLDLARLERLTLSRRPLFQEFLARFCFAANYDLPPRVQIELENIERIPDVPVIFAMNHTDRYNYWPFQYRYWRARGRFTASWVKGKYYENPWIGGFMEAANNIPTVSRGYLVSRDFKTVTGRAPTEEQYHILRAAVEAAAGRQPEPEATDRVPAEIFNRPRNILGHEFKPGQQSYGEAVDTLFRQMMARFSEVNREAIELGLDLLIFPEGTRSVRLCRGHIGLPQIALWLGVPVVPIGCNGSDQVYPGESPIARPGKITYRVGEPIWPEEAQRFAPKEAFEPFTAEAEKRHGALFQGFADLIMERINGLLDERHQFSEAQESEGVHGVNRFI